MGDWGAFLLFSGVVLAFIIGLIVSSKADKKAWEEREAKDLQWEKDENEKPKSYIYFITIDNAEKRTKDFEPYQDIPGFQWNYHVTSKGSAQEHLRACYKRNYFVDDAGVSYPTCNIKRAAIVTRKSTTEVSVNHESNDGQPN